MSFNLPSEPNPRSLALPLRVIVLMPKAWTDVAQEDAMDRARIAYMDIALPLGWQEGQILLASSRADFECNYDNTLRPADLGWMKWRVGVVEHYHTAIVLCSFVSPVVGVGNGLVINDLLHQRKPVYALNDAHTTVLHRVTDVNQIPGPPDKNCLLTLTGHPAP